MRTLVLSDLHLGCGADPGIFAGAHALAELLARLWTRPLRVVLNGDTFDFLAQDTAGDVAYALAQDPTNATILAALGRVVERRGELIFRGGRHDRELERTAVQAHILRGLRVSARAAPRVSFHAAAPATACQVGGARVLVGHALGDDDLAGDDGLAQTLLNPLRRQYGVGLADLLRPHPVGAALAALAVNPTAVKHMLRDVSGDAAQILRGLRPSAEFQRAALTEREHEVLALALDPDVVLGADSYDDGALRRARLKLLRASLGAAATSPQHPRDLSDGEWATARALARDAGASAVITGHTHAAGWRRDDGLAVCDTGAWTWLAHVPPADSAVETWQAYLEQWQRTPRIDARLSGPPPTRLHFTGALIDPHASGRGARLTLVELRGDDLVSLREHSMPPHAG